MNNNLKLMWKSESGESFSIGKLSCKGEKYYFQYNIEETQKAVVEGFNPMEGFPKLNVKYFKEELFSTFQNWLGDKSNGDMEAVERLKQISINGFSFENENFVNESAI